MGRTSRNRLIMAGYQQICPPSKSSGDFTVTPLGADLGTSEDTVFYSSKKNHSRKSVFLACGMHGPHSKEKRSPLESLDNYTN
jgi:hypothetical protein